MDDNYALLNKYNICSESYVYIITLLEKIKSLAQLNQ